MASISTITVGPNAQPLAPAPVAGAAAAAVTVINLDTANTVNLGSTANQLALELGPLASVTLSAPVWAAAAQQLQVGIIPGGSNYSPGSLTITGPVTAEITGPVTVEGTVDIGGTTDVEIQNANIDVIGAGGFILPGQLATVYQNAASVVIGAGGSQILGPVNVGNYASLDFAFSALSNNVATTGSAMCALVTFNWFDSSGFNVSNDAISVCQGQAVVGSLPCRGTSVQVTVRNPGSTGALTFPVDTVTIDGSYRSITDIEFACISQPSPGLPTFANFTLLNNPSPVNVIDKWVANISVTGLTAGANYMILLPMFIGEVTGYYQVVTGALSANADILDLAIAKVNDTLIGAAANAVIYNIPASIDANPVPVSFNLPPSQCAVTFRPSATNTQFILSLIGATS